MSYILTEKQEVLLKFIEDYQLKHGKSPTIKEMREWSGVNSDNSILKHLKALEEKKMIEKDDTPRGIKLLNSVKEKLAATFESFNLPVLGVIPAGGPVLSEEYVDSWMNVGKDLLDDQKEDYFLLKVNGNSMINAGIFEGDLVLVNAKKRAKNQDIVVALVDGENTLKRLIDKGDGNIHLQAENPDYEDIHPAKSLEIQGVVTALIRQY